MGSLFAGIGALIIR
ncbi:hypothetical protein DMB77_09665 [Staphylococcus saccharolyticus]|nr:hypothetical protein DMB74_09660 [Staphylococcus saccharolyticus]TAA91659.1 hypothetical protein DMB77_09665 [Staphylococcus saccharolyticus]